MAECFNCGAAIPRGQGYRREVYTGHSSWIYFCRRISTSRGNRYAVRTLCANCTQRLDKQKRLHFVLGVGAVLLLVVWAALSQDDSKTDARAAGEVSETSSAGTVSYPDIPSASETNITPPHHLKRRHHRTIAEGEVRDSVPPNADQANDPSTLVIPRESSR
jgi:hypothetical protein